MLAALYVLLGGRSMVAAGVTDHIAQWLARRTAKIAPAALRKYREATSHFLKFLGAGVQRDVVTIAVAQNAAFRDDLTERAALKALPDLTAAPPAAKAARKDQ